MVDVLSGSRLKLARARQHLSAMHAAMRKYIEMEFPQEAENSRLELSDKWQALTWLSVPDTDPMIGTLLGDFAHNLRCALDHAIWALVDANGQKPGRHTQFPGAVTESDWRDVVTHGTRRSHLLPRQASRRMPFNW